MKFLKNKNGFSLIELVISLMISSILFFIIFSFLASNSDELTNGEYRISIYDQGFDFRDKLNKFILDGYIDISIISTYDNDVLYLKDSYDKQGVIFGVVDRNTMQLQKESFYGNNILGYRLISDVEIANIESDNSIIYDYNFFNDKIYTGLIMKDFNVNTYNSGVIIDIFMGILPSYNSLNDGLSFSGNTYLSNGLYKFNLNF